MAGSCRTTARSPTLKGRKVLAFAGIGDPEKFFATAVEAGIAVTQRKAFPDHHRFTAEEAAELEMDADSEGLALLTTEKDRARMTGDPALHALATQAARAAGDAGIGRAGEIADAGDGRAAALALRSPWPRSSSRWRCSTASGEA